MIHNIAKELMRISENLQAIEKEYGIVCTNMRGIACIERETLYFDLSDCDMQKLWDMVTEDGYGFIGMMPNQWRPEIHINCIVKGVRIGLYSFDALGYNTFDGGFLSGHDAIREATQMAPQFIKDKIEDLRKRCESQRDIESAEAELKELETRRTELLNRIG